MKRSADPLEKDERKIYLGHIVDERSLSILVDVEISLVRHLPASGRRSTRYYVVAQVHTRNMLTFPQAFAPVTSRQLFAYRVASSSPAPFISATASISDPAFTMTSFETKVSTTSSWRGCLCIIRNPSKPIINKSVPSLTNMGNIERSHRRPTVVVLSRCFCKAEKAVELGTRIAWLGYSIFIEQYLVQQALNNLYLAIYRKEVSREYNTMHSSTYLPTMNEYRSPIWWSISCICSDLK